MNRNPGVGELDEAGPRTASGHTQTSGPQSGHADLVQRSEDGKARPLRPAESPPFPVVGLGASAGGLSAFSEFLAGLPTDHGPGMAFVLVQHLLPDHKSVLTDLVAHRTRLRVRRIEDGMTVEVDTVYVIPPDCEVELCAGQLRLFEASSSAGHRLPIDTFFRSLARELRERAIGIILSGTGSDGSLGARAIKSEGGMVMVQAPETAEHPGMPLSALETGLVDCSLSAGAMATHLIAYVALSSTQRDGGGEHAADEDALQRIFALLRERTGHDFSQYKRNTVQRRIERRMAVRHVNNMGAYAALLESMPAESDILFKEMLIGVTSFFRDAEAFVALERQVIPRLVAGKPDRSTIRVWCAGCSTGEEAYSLAMLLQERVDEVGRGHSILVFATDLDGQAIATARAGIYPLSVAEDIDSTRLARHFTIEPDGSGYRISKRVRDCVVFSDHDLVKDPPFSRLDLISCRNLLIYMDSDLQRRIMLVFHYALNPDGMLFLGGSESVGELTDLFGVLDRKLKLYSRRPDLTPAKRTIHQRLASGSATARMLPSASQPRANSKYSVREIAERALLQLAPASVLVDAKGDILYLHGRTGAFLEPVPGEVAVSNVLRMAREGLRRDLTTALHKAVFEGVTVKRAGIRVKTNGHFSTVNLTVRPAPSDPASLPANLYLVILQDAEQEPGRTEPPVAASEAEDAPLSVEGEGARIAELIRELRAREEYIAATSEELESSNEDLRASNEEMQAVNEELQATNEELETSKEELQSVNEELATVNAELQNKVADLSRLNNDIINLMAGTGIATVFVDLELRVVRFTPAAMQITNLIPGDVGRPFTHIVTNLVGYDTLAADAREVLSTLEPRSYEVRTHDGTWYAMGLRPYRTLDDTIEGMVITFVDISAIKLAQQEVTESASRSHTIMQSVGDYIVVLDGEQRISYINHVRAGLSLDSVLGSYWLSWLEPEDTVGALAAIRQTLSTHEPTTIEVRAAGQEGELAWFQVKFSHLPAPEPNCLVLIARDITERRKIEQSLRLSDLALKAVSQGVLLTAPDATILSANDAFLTITGYHRHEVLGRTCRFLQGPYTDPDTIEATRRALRTGTHFHGEIRNYRKDGTTFWNDLTISPIRDAGGTLTHFIGVTRDVTARKEVEEALRWKRELVQLLSDASPLGSVVVDHKSKRILHQNARFFELWGIESLLEQAQASEVDYDELVRRCRAQLLDPDAVESASVPLRDELNRAVVQDEVLLKDGRVLKRFSTQIRDAADQYRGRFYLFEDVTDQRRAEHENARLEARLRQAEKMESVGRLAGGVAHDFNNMLGVILGHAELAMSDLAPNHPIFSDLREMQAAAERSAALTQQLLAFARKQTVAPRVLSLNHRIEASLTMLRRLIGEQVQLSFVAAPDSWVVKMDPSQVDQILTNLCVNARDAIDDVGQIRIETENCTIEADYSEGAADCAPGDYVRLSVSDSGVGIEPEALPHIFEPFFTTKAVGKGTGLGLSTVYGALKQNRGFVRVASELGKGTTFHLYFPRHRESLGEVSRMQSPSPARGGAETVLLVEDESAILRLTSRMLRRQGYTVLEAAGPSEALTLAREYQGPIHLLMTDVVMPEMNGRDLLKNVLGYQPKVRCLFMSGYPADVIAQHGVLDRSVHFIEKPFSVSDLAGALREVLDPGRQQS